eukprot:11476349-Ditylum_brightwellii.AAC.1
MFQSPNAQFSLLVGGDYLQFTTELWQPPAADKMNLLVRRDKKEEGVTVIYDAKFPFLDIEIFWDEKGEMRFQVYRKENQVLKYVDKANTHRPTTFKSIANGVFTRLARLTSNTATNQNLQIDELYPDHAEALFTADLASPMDFPTFKELWEEDEQLKNQPKN